MKKQLKALDQLRSIIARKKKIDAAERAAMKAYSDGIDAAHAAAERVLEERLDLYCGGSWLSNINMHEWEEGELFDSMKAFYSI